MESQGDGRRRASVRLGLRARLLAALAVAGLGAAFTAPTAAAEPGLMAWGYNAYGELGNGTTTRSTVPVSVSGLTSSVKQISAGSTFALALRSGGTVNAWGANEYGQLGIGNST